MAEVIHRTRTGIETRRIAAKGRLAEIIILDQFSRNIYRNQPHVFDITVLPQYIGTQTGWMNNNPFVGVEGYKGGKHGYTTAAGRTAVAIFNEEIDGRTLTLGYIILGSTNLKADMQILRDSVHNSATEN